MAIVEAVPSDDFLSFLKGVHIEIQAKFLKAHSLLQKREAELLAQLQELENEYIGSSSKSKQIEELVKSKNALTAALTGNANQDVLAQNLANIDKRIKELELKSYSNLVMEWDDGLYTKLSTIGNLKINGVTEGGNRDYRKIEIPVSTFGTHSKRQLSSPCDFTCPDGMEFDPATNFLYICETGNNCVKVFDKSYQFMFLFSEKMGRPDGICIKQGKVYVTQSDTDILNIYTTEGKFLETVGGNGEGNLEFDTPRGLCVTTEMTRIYIAEYGNHRVHCLKLDLTFHSIIQDVLGARDVQLTTKEILVLSLTNPCVSIYTYAHDLIRKIIPHDKDFPLQNPVKFVMDKHFNIIITDFDNHCICIYSYRGEFLHKFGKEGKQKGEFIHPKGIALSPQGQIVVNSDNPKYCIQAF